MLSLFAISSNVNPTIVSDYLLSSWGCDLETGYSRGTGCQDKHGRVRIVRSATSLDSNAKRLWQSASLTLPGLFHGHCARFSLCHEAQITCSWIFSAAARLFARSLILSARVRPALPLATFWMPTALLFSNIRWNLLQFTAVHQGQIRNTRHLGRSSRPSALHPSHPSSLSSSDIYLYPTPRETWDIPTAAS